MQVIPINKDSDLLAIKIEFNEKIVLRFKNKIDRQKIDDINKSIESCGFNGRITVIAGDDFDLFVV